MLKIRFKYFWIIFACLLCSCATVPTQPPIYPTTEAYPPMPAHFLRQDIFHVVGPGETIWRLSKMYDVEMSGIMQANNLKRPQDLEMGQRILVPQAAPLRPVVPLYRSNKWKYIIIHHSATDQGNALSLFNAHLKRGFWQGLGYHFIIGNGTYGKKDGQIEASPRWVKQQDGAHCQAARMNYKGIGICLVGNFSKERVSAKQMDSLAYLVNILKEYYHVPPGNILGHGQVPGARTECPGKYFPWEELRSRLKASK